MKTGILTFQFADNYGAMLQAYALKKYMEDLEGQKVSVLNYRNYALDGAYSVNPFKKGTIKGKIKAFVKFPMNYIQHRKFDKFRTDVLEVDKKVLREVDGAGYEKLIVGSDQVWNMGITYEDMNYFFSNVDDSITKCYAYAASSNDSFVPEKFCEEVKKHLAKFEAISARENSLTEIIKEKFDLPCETVLDPVLLYGKEFWSEIEKKSIRIPEKYILVYALEKSEKLEKIARLLQEEKKCEVVIVHPLGIRLFSCGRLLREIGPQEFVYLVHNAECIVSNSFHAFAFSCIFNKQIYFTYLDKLSGRVKSLIKLINVEVEKIEETNVYFAEPQLGGLGYESALSVSKEFLGKLTRE